MNPDGKTVYISNRTDNTVTAIDASSLKILAEIPVGKRPWNMATSRDGKLLFVANGKSNSVTIIDTATNTVSREVPVGATPWGVFLR